MLNINKRKAAPLQGGFAFIAVAFILLSGCSSGQNMVTGAVPYKEGAAVIAAEKTADGSGLYLLSSDSLSMLAPAPEDDIFVSLYKYDSAVFAVSEKNGIYIYHDFNSPPLRVPVGSGGIPHNTLTAIHFDSDGETRRLYTASDPRRGSGLTICEISYERGSAVCETMNTKNSDLRSDHIAEIRSDVKGHIWIRYPENLALGVTRIGPDGRWRSFTSMNSELGENGVQAVRPEPEDMGLKGSYVWFVTRAGLTSLQYKSDEKAKPAPEKKRSGPERAVPKVEIIETEDSGFTVYSVEMEESGYTAEKDETEDHTAEKEPAKPETEYEEIWKLYGEKRTGGLITRMLGIQDWFTDAIVGITSLAFTDDAVIIAVKDRIFRFDGEDINSYAPETGVGGLDDLRIHSIMIRNGLIIVRTVPFPDPGNVVRSVSVFNIEKREWKSLDIWSIGRENPGQVEFIPYKENEDLVVFTYNKSESKFATFNLETGILKPLKVNFPGTE